MQELVDGQPRQLEELTRRVAALEGTEQRNDETEVVDAGDDQSQVQNQDWRPPWRRPGMPDAGVVALEEQPDEEHAFGPAEPLVAEWREIRIRAQDGVSGAAVLIEPSHLALGARGGDVAGVPPDAAA